MAKNYYDEIAEKFPEFVNVEIKFDTKDPLHRYVLDHSVRLHPSQIQLIEATRNVKLRIMMSCSDQIQLLQNLVVATGAKKIVDVGTFTGYSALSLALVLPPGGKVYTCDMHDTYLNIAQDAWKAGKVDNLIEFRQGPAVDTLKNLIETEGEAGTFDFIYVDADKENYENYFELSLQLLRPGGIIAIDNVLWFGRVADPAVTDPATETMRKFNAKVAKDTRINISMLTTGDGTTLCFKK